MTDWLARARLELMQRAGTVTANTAERNPMAVTAVRDCGNAEILRASIGSNGSDTTSDLQEFGAVGEDDDRRTCDQCANLIARRCQAAKRGEFMASRSYEPIRDIPRRCEGYAPGADDTDRRHGHERWPGPFHQGEQ